MWQRLISWLQSAKAETTAPASADASPTPALLACRPEVDADQPPPLATSFDLAVYRQFMCDETYLYRASYIQKRIDIKGAAHFTQALEKGSVIVVFVHHGSWLLMNGALHHLCGGAPITSIASRRNLEFCTPEEKAFWLGVHKRSAESCNAPTIFYTDQSPIGSVRWLKQAHHVLTVALDVREPAADKPEQQFEFMGQSIYLQTGPAKLAQLTGAQVVPAAIEYNAQTQRHLLTLHPAIDPTACTPEALTQTALDCIGPHVMRAPEQQFYDLLGALQVPQKAA